MQWTACGLVRSASQRALLARSSLRLAVAGPVHGVKTHVPCNRNARGMCQSEYAASLIHNMRPLNRRETRGVCKSRDPQFPLRAVCSEASAKFRRLEFEVGASGIQLLADIRCRFGSKSKSLRVGGLPRRRFAAAGLLPLAQIAQCVGRVPWTMSASAPMCVALYVK